MSHVYCLSELQIDGFLCFICQLICYSSLILPLVQNQSQTIISQVILNSNKFLFRKSQADMSREGHGWPTSTVCHYLSLY